MDDNPSRFKTFMKITSWLAIPIALATVATLHINRKAAEQAVSITIPMKSVRVLARTFDFIDKNYVNPDAIKPLKMLREASKDLVRAIPPLLIKDDANGLDVSMGDKKLELSFPKSLGIEDVPGLLSKLLGFLDLNYQGRLDEQERLTLAMTGVTDTLDPHTNYLPPKIFNEFRIGTKGNFGGLGIVIGIREGDLSVIAPLEGTPAYQAGIKAKDKIIQIGEESTINMGLTEAVEKLRGPVGSKVSIIVTRESVVNPMKFTLTRALIHIQSVAGRVLEVREGKKIGLIKLKNFQEDTLDQFKKTVESFKKEGDGLQGLILDLRNNPGGLLDQAVTISDYFISKGMIVKTVGPHQEPLEVEKATAGDPGEDLAVVVIVNEGSASASEIVAGALQFNDRAVVIGNRSFGKGSVQTVYDLKDGSALKLTIAQYLTAKDQKVQSIGINPDVGLIPATIEEMKPGDEDSEKDKTPKDPNAPKKLRVDLFEDVKKRELDLLEAGDDEEEHKDPNLPPSPYKMTYWGLEKKEEDENAGKIDLENDFPVLLASRILSLPEARSLSRPDMMKGVPTLLNDLKKGEDEKMKQELAKVGVDWSAGPQDGKPSGETTIELLDDKDNPRKTYAAGDSGYVRVTVENKGSAPFYQLAAVTKSEDPLFANLEFPLGRVNPGDKKTWKAPIKVPNFVHRRDVPVELTFHEAYDRFPKAEPFSMTVEETATPLFEYSYTILDDGAKGSKGNGNHLVDKGETIALDIHIKNSGSAASQKPIVNLKKDEGGDTFIETGREELAPMAPGGEIETVLRFRVPAQNVPDKLKFDFNIHDGHLGEDLSDQWEFPIGAAATPAAGAIQSPPRIETSPELPLLVTSGDTYVLKGKATDDHELKHVFVFVGDDKVFYQSPSGPGQKSLDFEAKLPLKKGANLITLAAQDDRELTTRKQWIVWRGK